MRLEGRKVDRVPAGVGRRQGPHPGTPAGARAAGRRPRPRRRRQRRGCVPDDPRRRADGRARRRARDRDPGGVETPAGRPRRGRRRSPDAAPRGPAAVRARSRARAAARARPEAIAAPCRWRWPLRRNPAVAGRRAGACSTIAASRTCSGLRDRGRRPRCARGHGSARGEVATRTDAAGAPSLPAGRGAARTVVGVTRSSAAPRAGPNPGGAATAACSPCETAARSRSWRDSHHARSSPRTEARRRRMCTVRSSCDISRPRSSISDVPATSAAETVSASCASCSAAPAVSDSTRRGAPPTIAASFATQVHAVDHRVDQHHVGERERGDRQRVLGAVEQPDRRRIGVGHAVDAGDDLAHRGGVARVLGHVLAADRLDRQEADLLPQVRPALQQMPRTRGSRATRSSTAPAGRRGRSAADCRLAPGARGAHRAAVPTAGPRANATSESGSMEIGYARTQIVRPRQRTWRPAGSTRASRTNASTESRKLLA